jgi:hypothetical protein
VPGNSLFIGDGVWDVFREVSKKTGMRNEDAYNRQPCFGDVNRDGWFDIAIGCDNIKAAWGGLPHSRLYVSKDEGGRDDGRCGIIPEWDGEPLESWAGPAGCPRGRDRNRDWRSAFGR